MSTHLPEMAANGSGGWQWAHTNVLASGLSATYDADLTGKTEGAMYFHLSDWLGTRRQQTDFAGNPLLNFTGLPYGDGLGTFPVTNTDVGDATEHHFTGKERDAETGLDYFGARYYGSNMGRFLSPDWSSTPQAVPYAHLDDPQSLNLYSYARNNPLVHIDADGHCWSIFQAACNFFKSVVNEVRYREFTPDSRLANIRSLDRAERHDRQAVTAAMAGATRRLSSAQLRALWERANPGQKVPFDEARGRFYDMDHIEALADGGIEDDPANLQPLERGEHMAKHAGDFARWGARAADTAKEAGKVIESSAEDAGGAIKDAATEVVNNPGEALQDAAKAVESGEILPP